MEEYPGANQGRFDGRVLLRELRPSGCRERNSGQSSAALR